MTPLYRSVVDRAVHLVKYEMRANAVALDQALREAGVEPPLPDSLRASLLLEIFRTAFGDPYIKVPANLEGTKAGEIHRHGRVLQLMRQIMKAEPKLTVLDVYRQAVSLLGITTSEEVKKALVVAAATLTLQGDPDFKLGMV